MAMAMEHVVNHFPRSLFSEEMETFLKTGPTWSAGKEMRRTKSAKDKGWKVKVHWEEEYIDNICVGLGVFADEQITNGTVLRHGEFGQNLLPFDQYSNIPNLEKTATVDYLRNYAGTCPCSEHMIMFLPGISYTHSNEANVMMVAVKDGVDLVATKDITKGEALRYDYRKFGRAPDWFVEMLMERTGDSECAFGGYNDYVM